jgi:hypothetical protein
MNIILLCGTMDKLKEVFMDKIIIIGIILCIILQVIMIIVLILNKHNKEQSYEMKTIQSSI